MKKTVIILSHPDYKNSIANKTIINNIQKSCETIEVRHLDGLYPNFNIDVEVEQKALLEADNIILQFPFFWYSIPALMKHWLDTVFTYNFAYGSEGDKLSGKEFLLSFTVGGPEESYSQSGYNTFKIDELIKPLEQTANLSRMNWNKPLHTHGMIYIPDVYNTKEEVLKRAEEHSKKLIKHMNTKNEIAVEIE